MNIANNNFNPMAVLQTLFMRNNTNNAGNLNNLNNLNIPLNSQYAINGSDIYKALAPEYTIAPNNSQNTNTASNMLKNLCPYIGINNMLGKNNNAEQNAMVNIPLRQINTSC